MPLFIASTALIGHAANVICGAQLRARADPWTAHEALRPDARPIEVLRALSCKRRRPAELFSDFWFLEKNLENKAWTATEHIRATSYVDANGNKGVLAIYPA